tara:strand:+ start:802 stop:933 length:132 start_codon:yes stop_codon:yes gene_type:complete
MTAGYGIGMLIMGLFAIGIIAGVGYYVINRREKEEKKQDEDLK